MKMFCTNCGKRIIDTARFCNYCGAKIVDFDENRDSVSDNITENPASSALDNVINTENVENSGNLLKMTASVSSYIPQMNEPPKSGYSPDSVPLSYDSEPSPETSVPPEAGTATAYPNAAVDPYTTQTTSVSPEMGTTPAYPDTAASGLPETGTPAAPAPTGLPKEETPRKYTLGHLIMCLAASGVMAIAAGIFAGLYFSVV